MNLLWCLLIALVQLASPFAGASSSHHSRPHAATPTAATAASIQPSTSHSGSVSWFIQLSDLHISKWMHHEIVPDLHAFGQQVLASAAPGAVLLTGDLVDAKTRPEGSQQHESEWQAYEEAWHHLAESAQLPASAILDLRGNHDAFDTLRNSGQDLYTFHSATAAAHGQAAAASQRVWAWQLAPQLLLPRERQQSRRTHRQQQRQQQHAASSGGRLLLLEQQHMYDPAVRLNSSSSSVGGSRQQPGRKLTSRHMQQQQQQQQTAYAQQATAAAADGSLGIHSGKASNSSNQNQHHERAVTHPHMKNLHNIPAAAAAAVAALPPGDAAAAAAARAVLAAPSRAPQAAAAAAAVAGGPPSCPAAVLLGLDFTPNVGLHSPANFFGVASAGLLQQLQQQLRQLRGIGSSSDGNALGDGADSSSSSSFLPQHCRSQSLPIISYSHYPFSTVTASYGSSGSGGGRHGAAAAEGGRAVCDMLARYDVSAHLSGHLHDLVGPRMHVMHVKRQPAGSGRLGFSQPGGGAKTLRRTYLADLESADWKEARRWRLVAVDSGATSFADLTFERTTQHCSSRGSSSSGGAGSSGSCEVGSSGVGGNGVDGGFAYAVSAVDSSRAVAQHVVLLTWPPDGRYSPLMGTHRSHREHQVHDDVRGEVHSEDVAAGADEDAVEGVEARGTAPQQQQQQQQIASDEHVLPVRALVVPLQLHRAGSSGSSRLADVQLQWYCGDAAAAAGFSGPSLGSSSMYPVGRAAATAAAAEEDAEDAGDGGFEPPSLESVYPYDLPKPQVFAAHVPLNPDQLALGCGSSSSLLLQVTVTDGAGGVSTSDLRPVLLPHLSSGSSGGSSSSSVVDHLPLPVSWLEWYIVTFDGATFAVRLFYTGWLLQVVGLLLLPRLLARQFIALNARMKKLGSSSSSSSVPSTSPGCRPASSALLLLLRVLQALAAVTARALRGLAWQVLRLLLLPFVSMAVLAQQHPGVWGAVLAHSVWVLVGPWFMAQLASSSQGLGFWFRYGLLLPLPAGAPAGLGFGPGVAADSSYNMDDDGIVPSGVRDAGIGSSSSSSSSTSYIGGWQQQQQQMVWMSVPDTFLISSLVVCIILAPVTLWVGLVVSCWHGAAAAARHSSSSGGGSSSSSDLAAAAAAAAVISGHVLCRQVSKMEKGEGEQEAAGKQWNAAAAAAAAGGSSSSSGSQQQQDGEVASSCKDNNHTSSSCSTFRLGRSRSNPLRRRESVELSISVAGGDAGVHNTVSNTGSDNNTNCSFECPHLSRSSSSCAAGCAAAAAAAVEEDEEDEERLLLAAAAAVMKPTAPAGAAAGPLALLLQLLPAGLLSNSGASGSAAADSCWWLLPLFTVPSVAPATPKRGAAAAAAGGSSQKIISTPAVRLLLLPPWYLTCYCLYSLLLVVWAVGRVLQLCLVTIRLPAHLVLLLVPSALFWYKICWRLAAAYGPVALITSPVVGWLPLLLVGGLRRVRQQMGGSKARRQE